MNSSPDALDSAQLALLQQRLTEALKFLSHDVREGHSSTLALLELQRIKSDPMPMGQLIERVERNARRSLAAIDDFLDVARSRLQPLRADEIDLADLLVEVVADAWSPARLRGIRVHVVDTPEVVTGWGDRELISGAIAKLLRDVVARTADGADLQCSVQPEPSGWRIEIDDPGYVPEPPKTLPKEVARRERAEPGLLLAKLVAERHGGSVELLPRPDQGRRVVLHLPQRPATDDAEP